MATFHPIPSYWRFQNLTGRRFGRLVVLGYLGKNSAGKSIWLCKCDCGTEKAAVGAYLRKNGLRSCGCLFTDTLVRRNTTHGLKHIPEYRIWQAMIERCRNPGNSDYHLYGGRGIRVCQRWLESFANFVADMGRRPSAKHSIDRYPDTNGNYESSNCRWATGSQQCRNRRNNHLLTFRGETLCVTEWAERLGIPAGRIRSRINIRHWPVERALLTPALGSGGRKKFHPRRSASQDRHDG